ncbi:hypothetical protein [Lysobacter fragariae]
MRFLSMLFAGLSLFAFAGGVQARVQPLTDPAPVSIPSGVDQAKVVKDIKRALMGRGWEVTAENPGEIDSTLHLRDHVARIKITYDEKQVKFAYVDSANLDYREKKGVRYIHGNYLGWINYLTTDLATNFTLTAGE